jgi:hypothetical protein
LTSNLTKCGAIGKTLNGIADPLATELTDLERQYLHKRIAEEYAQLKRLEKSQAVTAIRPSLSTLVIGAATEATDQEAYDLLKACTADSVCPAICMTEGCDHTSEMEPDQDAGYCEACARCAGCGQ